MIPNLTTEQQEIVDYVSDLEGEGLILIDSVAGSGKTTLLKAIANTIEGKGLYMAYNKAIAVESAKKFPSHVDCKTTHSLAYRGTVVPLKLSVGFFGPREVTDKIPYNEKYLLCEDIKEFCLSKYTTYDAYAKANGRINASLANKYLTKMSQGDIDCTHDFYLKLFHIMLANGEIDQVDYDLIMLDEAGDLNEVTLEIFKLLAGRIKVAVGDPHQNIYTFNHTINCFERLEGQGKTFKLSKSFRVPQHIAGPVEKFCQTYLNPEMQFNGVEVSDPTIKTRGYISRTNSGLIGKIIELNEDNVPYGLVRKAQEIFKVPLMVAGLRYQGKIYDAAYKHIQDDVDNWFENKDNVKINNPTLFGYLRSKYPDDLGLKQALSLIANYGKSAIFDAYYKAKEHESRKHDFLLLTAHSSKGLEFDEVILAPDMTTSVDMALERTAGMPMDLIPPSEKETFNLYYVACTRALKTLRNATYLTNVRN